MGAVGAAAVAGPQTLRSSISSAACALGPPVGLGQFDVDHQAVPVLGQHVAQVAELRALLLALAETCA